MKNENDHGERVRLRIRRQPRKAIYDLGDLYIEMIIRTELMMKLSPKKCLAQS
jgi:hypothetical protein